MQEELNDEEFASELHLEIAYGLDVFEGLMIRIDYVLDSVLWIPSAFGSFTTPSDTLRTTSLTLRTIR